LTVPKSTLRPISSPIFLATNDLTIGGPTKKRNALKTRKMMAVILPIESSFRLCLWVKFSANLRMEVRIINITHY
jgi:hypothetical protein